MPPPVRRLTLDEVHRKELVNLGTAKRALTVDVTKERFLFSAATRLKGPFILTGFAGRRKGDQKGWNLGARLTAKWK